MGGKDIVSEIVRRRIADIEKKGYCFGHQIPEKRTRAVNPFMEGKGVILEVKRASPSKGDIAPSLDAAAAALRYASCGAGAISCLTEENYFKGSLKDLMDVCNALPTTPVLRKDFLVDEKEIEISYRAGCDAVLLIAGILTQEKLLSMTGCCASLGIRALVEVRTEDDVRKVSLVKEKYPSTVVCGVNSRNLKDFSIDLLVPAMLKEKLGGKVVFESGVTTSDAAAKIASMGFTGMLLGEYAARNPESAGRFVSAFMNAGENQCGKKTVELAKKVSASEKPMVKICGLTRPEDVELADSLGSDFVGFVFSGGFSRNVYGERFSKIEKILPGIKAMKVAVITETESEEAKYACSLVKSGVLDFLQMHGIRPEDVPESMRDVPHYFAVTDSTGGKSQADFLSSLGEARFLIDSKKHDFSGSGHLWIAGGITPENVADLVREFSPELVDVSGGVEENDAGIKDEEKMRKFFKEIRNI